MSTDELANSGVVGQVASAEDAADQSDPMRVCLAELHDYLERLLIGEESCCRRERITADPHRLGRSGLQVVVPVGVPARTDE